MPKLSMRTASPHSNVRSFPRVTVFVLDCRLSDREVVEVDARGVKPAMVVREVDAGVLGGGILMLAEGGPVVVLIELVIILEGRAVDTRLDCPNDGVPDCEEGEECGEEEL